MSTRENDKRVSIAHERVRKPQNRVRKYLALFALPAVVALSTQPVAAKPQPTPWQLVQTKRGVSVSVREEPGHAVKGLRAQARIKGSVLEVLAVVLDDARAKEWAKGSTESARLRALDAKTHLTYTRANQPWPVQDRDLVMKRTVDVLKPASDFLLRMTCVPNAKPKTGGVVRVKDCESTLTLRKVDEQTTAIDYQISLDPGGNIPKWLVEWTSERLPFDTVVGLERQVARTRGKYQDVVQYWASAT